MPALRPVRPDPVASLTVPAVSDEETRRAILPIVEAIRDLQRRIGVLIQDSASGGSIGVFFDKIITPPQIDFTTVAAAWDVGTLGQNTLIRCTVDSGSRNVSGLVGGVDGKIVTFMNIEPGVSGKTAFFLDQGSVLAAGAAASTRFNNAGNANVNGGGVCGCVTYYYDGQRSIWQEIWST